MKILIVDDKEDNRYLQEMLLKANGNEIQSAANGAEALEKLKTGGFELIISDILMPVMDGFQLCQTVKADETMRHIPFIFYTATYTGPQDEALAIKIGADRFIVKPCEPDVFMEAVRDVMTAAKRSDIHLPPPHQEEEVLKLYNERLVRKLEQKMVQLEKEVKMRREAEGKYRILVENANEAICVAQDKVLRFVNERTEELTGYSREELTSRPFTEFIHPDDKGLVLELYLKRLKGIKVPDTYSFRFVRRTGEVRWADVNVVEIDWEGKPGTQIFVRDITDRKQAEAEQKKLRIQLQQAQKMESIGQLAGGVAHDFNNLLSVILGYGELILAELAKDHPLREMANMIYQAGIRAKELTRQMLAFSRKQVLEMQVVDINAVMTGFRTLLRRIIGEDIEFVIKLTDEPLPAKADTSQIEQVLMNLAVNARDAMPDGGKLTIETAAVALPEVFKAPGELYETNAGDTPSAMSGLCVMIVISDTGCGMDKETLAHLFEPFFTTKGKDKGTGLGLATSYGIVKQHDGNIWVYSEPGQGTTFKIYLPLYTGKPMEKVQTAPRRELITGTATVMVIEDDTTVRQLTSHILKRAGYRVMTPEGVEDSIEKARQFKEPIHLVLTDVIMPGMKGPEVFRQIVKHHPEAKVLYVSGYAENAITSHDVLKKGFCYLQKPFTLHGLLEKVASILK